MLIMLGMLVGGACNTILIKIQLQTPAEDGIPFTHPFLQNANLFFGESLCLIIYAIKRYTCAKGDVDHTQVVVEGGKLMKTQINPIWLAIPATLDLIGSTCMGIGLTMVAASVQQMMRSFIILYTASMSVVFLRRKLYRHHTAALGIIFSGIFLVAVSFIQDASKNKGQTRPLGLFFVFIAQFFTASCLIVEEKILSGHYLDPLYIVGYEGFWGLLIWLVLLPIFQQIECTGALCKYGRLEDTARAFREFRDFPILIVVALAICVSIACFKAFGVAVTKNASAAQRATIDSLRTILIWAFFMVVPVYGRLLESFKTMQLIGFVVLVVGTLIFNEILVVRYFGFDRFTKRALIKNHGIDE